MKLTIHRGAAEIGGSCVELQSGDARLLIDLGIPLVKPGGGEFDMAEHAGADGPELVKRGVLPDVAGLYAWQEPGFAGILVSHAHQDHYGFLDHVHPDIPVHMGEGTAKLIEITLTFSGRGRPAGPIRTFGWPDRFEVGPFTVTPHLVDHSSFGAFAFEIAAGGKRVVYSGDFREHGHVGKATRIMLERIAPGADVLLLEGTMLGRADETVLTEQELAERARALCADRNRAVLVYQSGQNVSRAVSFFKAARATGRTFVLDVYMAHVLAELGGLPGGGALPYPGNPLYDGIRVWYPWHLTNRLIKSGREDIPYASARHKIVKEEIAKDPGAFLVFVRPGMESDLKRMGDLDGGVLIYSMWEGYRRSERTARFLAWASEAGLTVESLHTSGHATQATLRKTVETLAPRMVVPIHTFHPEMYGGMLEGAVRELGDGVVLDL